MIETLRKVLEGALERLHDQVTTYLPSLLAALTLVVAAWLAALSVRWVIYRIFKGMTIDKFLRQSGVAFMIDRSGRLRATRIVAESSFWAIVLGGFLMGLSVFNTNITTQMIQTFVFLLPKLLVAGVILVFLPATGQFVIPDLLGGAKTVMLGNAIQQQFGPSRDWPFGSAIAMVALAFVMIGLWVYARKAAKAEAAIL